MPAWLSELLTLKFRVGTYYLSVQLGGNSFDFSNGGGTCVGGVLELVIG